MPWYDIIWDYEPGGNVEHVAEHGIQTDDVESVIRDPIETSTSRTTGKPVATGYTADGRLIFVVYEHIDEITIYPITAYEIAE